MQESSVLHTVFVMCPRPGSNRHVDHSTWDFKSQASANSATRADTRTSVRHLFKIRNRLIMVKSGTDLSVPETTQIGLEPTASAVTGRRSNQLSHWALLFC